MTEFQGQWIDHKGQNIRPHVSVVMNFTKPTAEKPALLTLGEVETFLHEFGCSSDLTPILGTSICRRSGPRNSKKNK